MKRWWIAVVALGLLAWAAAEWVGPAQGDAAPAEAPWLWVYAPVNFQVDQEGDRLVELIRRAGKAGYNAVVVTDTKFGRMGDRPKNYYANLRRAAKAAEEAGVEIIPMTTSFGYSNDLLQNDPNLAERIAVRDCPFVVHDGKAAPADDANMLPMGDFETFKGDSPAGWDYSLVPKLCLGTRVCETPFRVPSRNRTRSRASRKAFPSRAWERGGRGGRGTTRGLPSTG